MGIGYAKMKMHDMGLQLLIVVFINARYGITIANSCIYVRQAYEDKYKNPQINPNDNIVIEMLKEKGYKGCKGWLGYRKLTEFGSTEKEIEQEVMKEIDILFDLLDF